MCALIYLWLVTVLRISNFQNLPAGKAIIWWTIGNTWKMYVETTLLSMDACIFPCTQWYTSTNLPHALWNFVYLECLSQSFTNVCSAKDDRKYEISVVTLHVHLWSFSVLTNVHKSFWNSPLITFIKLFCQM